MNLFSQILTIFTHGLTITIWLSTQAYANFKIKRNPATSLCRLYTVLENVKMYKYLGVLLTSYLSWSLHVDNISSKWRRLIGLFYHQFYHHTSELNLLKLYMSNVRPHLEYGASVWSHYLLHSAIWTSWFAGVHKVMAEWLLRAFTNNRVTISHKSKIVFASVLGVQNN